MDLDEVRDAARARLKGVCAVYKVCDGAPDRLCQGIKYDQLPRMGGAGSGASFRNNFLALERVRLRMRVVGPDVRPVTETEILKRRLSMPVLGASTSGTTASLGGAITEAELCEATVQGCKAAGTMSARGDGADTQEHNPGLDAIARAGGWGVQVFKPVEQGLLVERVRAAECAGVAAVGVDIDGFGSPAMAKMGFPTFRKTPEELRELVRATRLPFLFKGVMTVEDARSVLESGAAAIGVSNHGGRVCDHTPGVADVLPGIAALVEGRMTVIADGGVRTGYDALKYLALGADAVMVGRDLLRAAVGGGAEGVRLHMEFMRASLATAMRMTDCADLAAVGPHILC